MRTWRHSWQLSTRIHQGSFTCFVMQRGLQPIPIRSPVAKESGNFARCSARECSITKMRDQENRSKLPIYSVAVFLFSAVVITGCARFEPRPISPSTNAEHLEERSLTNSSLKSFLETG